ncbi:MAG TPA: DUF1292 domain-containing protein [Bacilli bacterium]|jgi:uncharacterized protein YrzB (UPF0473 family)|nr:DUF1292 domain-containing protein [Acholeplasmataceae bacterium]OQB66027.1 MAG: hypothetical protein BWX94_00215 [Tenericutes bacterium ADurb.Bin140]HOE78173.1 DUF1292 domain-containing protein [Bacilli bacterium]HON64511.1 DUF1292 domain-containing protein [Bacilli bacterium]HOR96394.1 DUF1292 domain-containing protein [Bacilli bacterium]
MKNLRNPNQQLTIIDEQGNETLCQILFTFESEEFNKKYVLFFPIESDGDDEENIAVMAASYTEDGDGIGQLFEIEDEAEWRYLEQVLADFEDSVLAEEDEEEHHHHHHHDHEHDCCEDCEDDEDCCGECDDDDNCEDCK